MKIQIIFKTPDAQQRAIDENTPGELSHTHLEEILRKYIKYGETCKIEIDSETWTARVIPVSDW